MIYRIIGQGPDIGWDIGAVAHGTLPASAAGRLVGAMMAGFGDEAWDTLPAPPVSDPRLRFWFTERGWNAYGRATAAAARATGRPYRVLRQKNPPASAVAYRDRWQVALLPARKPAV